MSARSRIRGPRFALTNPEKCRACIKCVYGNGEHAEWCERKNADTSALPSTVDGGQGQDGVRALRLAELKMAIAEASVSGDGTRINGLLLEMMRTDPDGAAEYFDQFAALIPAGDPAHAMFTRLAGMVRKLQSANAGKPLPMLDRQEEHQPTIN